MKQQTTTMQGAVVMPSLIMQLKDDTYHTVMIHELF